MDKYIPKGLESIEGIREILKRMGSASSFRIPSITLCNSLITSCVSITCRRCVLWYGEEYVLRHLQEKDNAIQFLLDKGLITKGEALELTLDYE